MESTSSLEKHHNLKWRTSILCDTKCETVYLMVHFKLDPTSENFTGNEEVRFLYSVSISYPSLFLLSQHTVIYEQCHVASYGN